MVLTSEQLDIKSDPAFSKRLYYDVDLVQKKFKLPSRNNNHKSGFFTRFQDSVLLIYFCLRDKRFRQILSIALKLRKLILKNKVNGPVYVKDAFVELGSTFIKIGQFLSSRSDLLPKEYTETLSELQDSLPPLLFDDVKKIIEQELRKPLDTFYKSIEQEPIASASIGQVHRAKLLNDAEVVIKVQRPNLNILFYRDLSILRCLASFFQTHLTIGKEREWVQIIDEIGRTLFEEINFIQEGKNADRLRQNLKYEDRICIPRVYWKLTSKKIITNEYIPGVKITDVKSLKEKGHDTKQLATVLVNAYFKQFFEDGFYHADPHPGNIVVRDDGVIVFYDFGMVGRIHEGIRNELANVLLCVVENDTDTLLKSLRTLKLLKQDANVTPIKTIIEQAVYDYYDGGKLNNLDLDDLEDEVGTILKEKPLIFPAKFTYAIRATGTLEGICRTLDENFSLIEVAKPYIQNWLKNKIPDDSKWMYLSYLFPAHSATIQKIKAYVEAIKDLPKQVSNIENKQNVNLTNTPDPSKEEGNILTKQDHSLGKTQNADSRLSLAYSVMLLLCFTFFGIILIQSQSLTLNVVGLSMLILSLAASIVIVVSAMIIGKDHEVSVVK